MWVQEWNITPDRKDIMLQSVEHGRHPLHKNEYIIS